MTPPAPVPRVAGLDYSLTSTGLATTHPHKATLIKPRVDGHARLQELKVSVAALLRQARPSLVVVESGSYASTSSTFHQLAGGWWILTHQIHQLGIPYATVAPSTLKRYATGSGKATKTMMLGAARAAWPGIPVQNDDAADALFLAALGAQYLGRPIFRSPAPDAVRVVDWPRVGRKPATPKKASTTPKARKAGRARLRVRN